MCRVPRGQTRLRKLSSGCNTSSHRHCLSLESEDKFLQAARVADCTKALFCGDVRASNEDVDAFRQLEYLDIGHSSTITLDGLLPLQKLKLVHLFVNEGDEAYLQELLSLVVGTPSLVAIHLLPMFVTFAQGKARIKEVVNALRNRLRHAGPDGQPIRVSLARWNSFKHLLHPFEDTAGLVDLLYSMNDPWASGEYIVIHRAELQRWPGPSLIDWHASEALTPRVGLR